MYYTQLQQKSHFQSWVSCLMVNDTQKKDLFSFGYEKNLHQENDW